MDTPHEPDTEPFDLARRLAYLELGLEDRERLATIGPRLKGAGEEFVEAFYRHLFTFPETARFLQQPEVVQHLKKLQKAHLESMLDAAWDEPFLARRRRVGDVHAQVGITPQI